MTRSQRQQLNAHQRLKSATACLHQSLERTYPFTTIPHHLTSESTHDALMLLVNWHESLELESLMIKGFGLKRFDLSQHNMALQPDDEHLLESLGKLYVLVGSSLGGKMILRHWEPETMDCHSSLMSYYKSLIDLHRYWPGLLKCLDQLISIRPSTYPLIQKGADSAFRQLLNQAEKLASKKTLITKIAS